MREQQQGSLDRSADNGALLDSLAPGLTAKALAETAKTAESIDTVRFAINPWTPIPNTGLRGFGFGVHIAVFKRMKLIPIKTYKNPVILPRTGGFAVGSITLGGAFPTGSVGSKIEHALQFPLKSAEELLIAWGPGGPNDIGFRMLDSLTADSDQGKIDAIALFRGVMESGERPGVSRCLEELPAFLKSDGLRLLNAACDNGVDFGTKDEPKVVKLSPLARANGENMLGSIASSIDAAVARAMKVLEATKSDLTDAKMGVKDVKRKLDLLDKWLLTQIPSFSMDSEVERAAQVTKPMADALLERREADSFTMSEFMEIHKQTLAQLQKANEINQQLAERILSQPPAPTAGSNAAV